MAKGWWKQSARDIPRIVVEPSGPKSSGRFYRGFDAAYPDKTQTSHTVVRAIFQQDKGKGE